jgi:hypothetical protein
VVLHRLLGDTVELLVEGRPSARLQLVPRHEKASPF